MKTGVMIFMVIGIAALFAILVSTTLLRTTGNTIGYVDQSVSTSHYGFTTCYDPDGHLTVEKQIWRATAVERINDRGGITKIDQDECIREGGIKILEASCRVSGMVILTERCPRGSVCYDGACI